MPPAPRPLEERFWGKVRRPDGDGCWEWMAMRTRGYGNFWDGHRMQLAHRVSWSLTNGPVPEGMFICHHCDNPGCVRPDHLFLGTPKDNAVDMAEKGRQGLHVDPSKASKGDEHYARREPHRLARGEKHGCAKLTEEQVGEIRRRRAAGEKLVPLAREFGVCHSTISHIATRRIWKEP